jgi:hypothetical protein
MEWSPISERITLARFKTKFRHPTIIQCCAPTEMTEKDKKEEFYQQLSEAITTVKKKGCNHSDGVHECHNWTKQ